MLYGLRATSLPLTKDYYYYYYHHIAVMHCLSRNQLAQKFRRSCMQRLWSANYESVREHHTSLLFGFHLPSMISSLDLFALEIYMELARYG